MKYLKDKDYNIKYITTDGKTKEVNIKPEQDMNKPQMINKLKSENKDFFKLVESKNLKEFEEKNIQSQENNLKNRIKHLYAYYLKEGIHDQITIMHYILDTIGNSIENVELIQEIFRQDKLKLSKEVRKEIDKAVIDMFETGYLNDDVFVTIIDQLNDEQIEIPISTAYDYFNDLLYSPDSILYMDDEDLEESDSIDEKRELLVEKDNKLIKDKLLEIIEKDAKENDYYYYDKDEWDNLSFEDKFSVWEERNYLDDYFDELGIETYEDSLQLSDTPVLNFINSSYLENMNPDEAMRWYWTQVDAFLTGFEEKMQKSGLLEGEVFYDGRSSRHIVIDNCLTNIFNYDKIKEAYEKLENDFIEYINNYTPIKEVD